MIIGGKQAKESSSQSEVFSKTVKTQQIEIEKQGKEIIELNQIINLGQNSQFNQDNSFLKIQLKLMSRKFDELSRTVLTQKEMYETLYLEVGEKEKRIFSLKEKLNETDSTNKSLKNQLALLSEREQHLVDEIGQKDKDITNLKNQLKQISETKNKISETILSQKEMKQTFLKELEQKNNENSLLNQTIIKLENQYSQLRQENSSLKIQVNEISGKFETLNQ